MISYRRTNISAKVGTTTSASLRTAFNQIGKIARDHEIVHVGLRGLSNAADSVWQRIADLRLEQRPVEGAIKRAETPPDIDEHKQDLQRSVNRRGPDYGPDTVEGERRAD